MEGISNNFAPKSWQVHKQAVSQPDTVLIPVEKTPHHDSEQAKQKRRKSLIVASGITAVLATYGAVFYRKNIMDFASGFIKDVYAKKEILSQRYGHTRLPIFDAISYKMAKFLDKTLMSTQMFVNFSAMKDSLSNKLARAFKMGTLCDKLSNFWEKLASKAVKSNYKNCDKSLANTHNQILALTEKLKQRKDLNKVVQVNGENYTVSQLISLIEKNMRETRNLYDKNFSIQSFENRNQYLKESLQGISEKFFNEYTSIDYYTKLGFTRFTVEEWLVPLKNTYQAMIRENKLAISNSPDDKFVTVYNLLKSFDNLITPKDTKSRNILKSAIKKLGESRKTSAIEDTAATEFINSDINRSMKILLERVSKDSKYSKETQESMRSMVQDIESILNNKKQGKLQETLSLLKALLPKEDYQKIRHQVNSTSEKMTKITSAEGDLYFDKLRDITLGSAFSDIVFGMLSPLATMGVLLAMDDTKEERISTTLKLGIPLIGGIATSTAFLFLLASGGKALIMSSLIGVGLNRIGTYADSKIAANRDNNKNPKINSIIKDINTSSTILASAAPDMLMQKAMQKGVDEIIKYTNNKLDEYNTTKASPRTNDINT